MCMQLKQAELIHIKLELNTVCEQKININILHPALDLVEIKWHISSQAYIFICLMF